MRSQAIGRLKARLVGQAVFTLALGGWGGAALAASAPVAHPASAAASAQASAASCDKLADPRPADGSATGRAVAVTQGQANRAACRRAALAATNKAAAPSQLKTRPSRNLTEKEYFDATNAAKGKPIQTYKY